MYNSFEVTDHTASRELDHISDHKKRGHMGKEQLDQLEALIDAVGLATLLDGIDIVCAGKAEHIEENWQDSGLARTWRKAGEATGRFADTRPIAELDRVSGR